MPHVTFIHGIDNKVPADDLHLQWLRDLSLGGLDLRGQGVTSELAYWADVIYETPLDPLAPGAEDLSEAAAAGDGADWADDLATAEERAFVEGLSDKLALPEDNSDGSAMSADPSEERIPLPWALKRPLMRRFIRDVHHYLFDAEHEPRPGERYRVRNEIRQRALDALRAAPEGGRHVVVGHSLGSVIGYDILHRVAESPSVDALLTLGSPLGIDEVQDRLRPEWTRADGFPSDKVQGRWINVFDPLDFVCAPDPRLANDFRRGGEDVVEDVAVRNEGPWRHGFSNYARRRTLTACLRDLLAGR